MIGTRRSSCVCKLEGRFVVEHEVVMRMREKKRKEKKGPRRKRINTARDRGRSNGATSRQSAALRRSLHSPLYFYHLRNPNESWYNVSLCLRGNSQDVEFGIQNMTEAIMVKVSSKQTS